MRAAVLCFGQFQYLYMHVLDTIVAIEVHRLGT